jgi:hypothetical protein
VTTPPLGVALLALATGVAAAWFASPTPPQLEGERWFKTLLARRLGGPDEASRAALRRFVPFHPLGRLVEQKLARPAAASLPGGPLPGERELLDALAVLPDREARWRRLTDASDRALLEPEAPLSPDHDARRWLGPSVDGDDVDAVARAAEERLHARWVLLRGATRPGTPDVGGSIARFAATLPIDGDPAAGAAALAERLLGLVPERDAAARLIVAAEGEAVQALLRALAEDAGLRDRVVAVVAVGGVVGGLEGDGPLGVERVHDWLAHHFRHERLDVEVVRLVPYVALGFLDPAVDPPGLPGLPVEAQRFPEPGFVGREPPFVEPVDVGVLPADPALPCDDVAAALRAFVDLLTLSRR